MGADDGVFEHVEPVLTPEHLTRPTHLLSTQYASASAKDDPSPNRRVLANPHLAEVKRIVGYWAG